MTRTALAWLALAFVPALVHAAEDRPTVLVVAGTPGTPEYGLAFRTWTDGWRDAARRAGADFVAIGQEAPAATGSNPTLPPATATASATSSPTGPKPTRRARSGSS